MVGADLTGNQIVKPVVECFLQKSPDICTVIYKNSITHINIGINHFGVSIVLYESICSLEEQIISMGTHDLEDLNEFATTRMYPFSSVVADTLKDEVNKSSNPPAIT